MKARFYLYALIPLIFVVILFITSNYLFLFPSVKHNLISEKKEMLKELTHVVLHVLRTEEQNYRECGCSVEEAKKHALERIKNINYGENQKSYFWITDLEPKMLMHPYRDELEGEGLSEYKDIGGNKLFVEAVEIVKKQNEGYIEYIWQWQDDSTRQVPKISFVKLFEEWGWVVGTGVYIDDIEEQLTLLRKKELHSTLFISFIFLILILITLSNVVKVFKLRKEDQIKLQGSEEKFRNLFHNTNDIIIMSDGTGTILDVNESTFTNYDTKREDVIGKTIFQMMPEKYHAKVIERIQRMKTEKLDSLEAEVYIKENYLINVEIKSNIYVQEGKVVLISILRDITTRKKFQKQLLNAIISGEEKERSRIAKELHDGLGPYLSTIKLYFQWLAESKDSGKNEVIIEKGNKSMDEAIDILKEISNNLTPHVLKNYGIFEAVNNFINKFEEDENLKIDFISDKDLKIPRHSEIVLYRVIIELINNTMKHACAKRIYIKFKILDESKLQVLYTDDGKGFDLDATLSSPKGNGLLNIENRISTINGDIDIDTKPGEGMKVNILINLN